MQENDTVHPEYCEEDIFMLDNVEIPKRLDQMISLGVQTDYQAPKQIECRRNHFDVSEFIK